MGTQGVRGKQREVVTALLYFRRPRIPRRSWVKFFFGQVKILQVKWTIPSKENRTVNVF